MTEATRATPTEKRITHDLMLTDGNINLGLIMCNSRGSPITGGTPWTLRQSGATRTSLQIRTGDADYSDYQLPYTPFTQRDWSGGRGSEDFEKDTTRFADNHHVDTRMGDIILGGKATEVDLSGTTSYIEPIELPAIPKRTLTSSKRFASMYTPSVSSAFSEIDLHVAPGQLCTVEIILDDTGSPSSDPADIIATASYSVPALKISSSLVGPAVGEAHIGANEIGHGVDVADDSWTVLTTIPISGSLIFGNSYWIVVTTTAIGYDALTGGSIIQEDTPASWSSAYADHNIYFKLTSFVQGMIQFFEYKGALYALVKEDSGAASRLYLNGYRFVAATGSTQTVIKTPAAMGFAVDELIGCMVVVVGGKCYDEDPNYRTIIANGTDTITLEAGYLNTPDTTTQIVILGCDTWNEIETTGLTKSVTSVVVANEIAYFAQGEDTNIRRMYETNTAGTWTRTFQDEGTSKASFLASLPAHTGKMRIWKFNNPVTGNPTGAYATPKAWGAGNLDFTTKPSELAADTDYPINIGDARSKITNVIGYGDPLIPYVIKDDEFGSINEGIYAAVPISEMRQVKSESNGKAAIQYGVYLFLSVLEGLERYYQNRLDDVGPNRDEGLPSGRRGNISCMVSYPGGIYMGVDGTAAGTSSVLFWNQIGYHEVYRALQTQRIRSLFIQTIPGGRSGRLWIGLSSKTVWLPVSLNPRQQDDYRYASTGSLESAWFNGGFKEINKFWRSLQVYAESLSAGQTITAEYMTDTDNTWHSLPDTFDTSPMQEVLMSSSHNVYGKRWKYRLTLTTDDDTKTPRVKAVTVPSVTRLPPNKAWSMTVLADDAMVDRQGVKQSMSAQQLMEQLETWADSELTPIPLSMRSAVAAFDNKKVFIEPPTIQPIEVVNGNKKSLKAIITLSVYAA